MGVGHDGEHVTACDEMMFGKKVESDEMNVSQTLASFAVGLKLNDLPAHILENLNLRILDYIASAAAGYSVNKTMNNLVLNVVAGQCGQAQCSLLFSDKKMSAAQAAYCNAFICNGADMDDGHMIANGHPGVCVIPAVLALAEWRRIGFEEMAPAIVAGYEIFIRLSGAINPSHLKRGFNSTGTSGTIAAAAAAARVLGLNAEQVHVAMGLAATSASGLMELNESGQAMKPINPAKSAYNGLMCALFAEAGAVGPTAPLDGTKGYLKAYADEVDMASITRNLGTEYRMDTTYIKLYPACRHMHAMIDCAAILNGRGCVDVNEIDKIILYTYPASEKLTGLIRYPVSEDEAKFSLTYASAIGLLSANFTLKDLYKAADMGTEIKTLIDRMEIVVCPELEDRASMKRGARMELKMRDGRNFASDVEVPKGEKAFPLTNEDMRGKLRACAEGVLSEKQQEAVFQMSLNFDKISDLTAIYTSLVPES